MKRRYFIAAGLAAVAGTLAVRFKLSTAETAIAKVVRKRLGYLDLDDAGVRQFARDLASRHSISGGRLKAMDIAGPLYTGFGFSHSNRIENAVRHGEERITSLYLMSSDFFVNGFDESRTVQYLSYYDPLVACNNPFARPPESTSQTTG
jgi:hypothetical protein